MTDSLAVPAPAPDPGVRGRVAAAVASAVDAVSGVRRSSGSGVEIATQYRGGRALGVRLNNDRVEVHIVAERPAVTALADRVHGAVRATLDAVGDRRPVDVVVDDLDITSLVESAS